MERQAGCARSPWCPLCPACFPCCPVVPAAPAPARQPAKLMTCPIPTDTSILSSISAEHCKSMGSGAFDMHEANV